MLKALVVCAALLPATTAYGQSVNQPGFTTGIPIYAQFPDGLWLVAIPQYGVRGTEPKTELNSFTPMFWWQTPLQVAGGKVAIIGAPILLEQKTGHGKRQTGFYNTYVGAQVTWDVGNGWGAGVRAASFLPQGGKFAFDFGTLDLRAGVTKLTSEEHFTANFIYGHPVDDNGLMPDYLNYDLTYTRKLKKFEVGAVAYGSTDLTDPYPGHRKRSQFAAGPLIGYSFGKVSLQLKATTDLTQSNMGGKDFRVWSNITVPLILSH